MADREVDPWVFSRKGKLGGSDVFIEGCGGVMPQFFRNCNTVGKKSTMLQEKWPRSHRLFCDLPLISNSILILLVVGHIVKTHPPPTEIVLTHLCQEAVDRFWNFSAKTMGEVY